MGVRVGVGATRDRRSLSVMKFWNLCVCVRCEWRPSDIRMGHGMPGSGTYRVETQRIVDSMEIRVALRNWNGIGWDGIGWDGMEWDGMEWDGMG